MKMDDIFGSAGLLSQKMNFYEYRPEQCQMARAVDRAFSQERYLLVEAGTGTGKTLAYLLPAVRSGKRVIISTGTKTLQEQLFFKDIPFIQDRLGFPFRASFMKGRNNYLCLRRFKLLSRQPFLKDREEVAHFHTLKKWALRTRTGDRAELRELPEDLPLWKEVCASSDHCLGQACEFFETCFITRRRQEAAGADIVIVNHHLFFADLAVRIGGYGEVLPRYEAVIFDEAHQLEEVATQYFGVSVSNFRFEELARDLRREATAAKLKEGPCHRMAADLLAKQEEFFDLFRGEDFRYRLREEHFRGKAEESADRLKENLLLISAHIDGLKDPPEGLRALSRRAQDLKGEFQDILNLSDQERVHWCEVRGRGVFLQASPIDVASELQSHLYPRMKTAIFTSATLSTQGNFRFLKTRLGLDGLPEAPEEEILDSSFDLKTQALLYLPKALPDPNRADFLPRAVEEMEKILKLTQGRAFLLFTSLKNMEESYRCLKGRVPYTCFLQGERPKSALIQAFKEDIHSVLFATASFWEGVDVQGEALSAVIIDRLPFSPPNEPILEARLERIASLGGNPFWDYQVPSAILLLKQGLGRLIRTRQDRGILAILDSRLWTKSYGKAFLASLPPCPVVHEEKAVADFFGVAK